MLAITRFLEDIDDPRLDRTKKHTLLDILVLTVCAVCCGADGWEDVARFGRLKKDWLQTFLELKEGIPSADTIRRVFEAIDAEQFEHAFLEWMKAVHNVAGGDVVAIDGKTLRGSLASGSGLAALHLVHAWSARSGVLLGQVATDAKSNEITAVPALLDLLDLHGALLSGDAMNGQKKIVTAICAKQADDVITVKENQKQLYDQIVGAFEARAGRREVFSTHLPSETGHGRREHRKALAMAVPEWLDSKEEWTNLRTIVCVTSTRTAEGITTEDTRYFVTSLPAEQIERIALGIRQHWTIENGLHWILDVTFGEDASRIRTGMGAQNFAIVRRMALNLFKQ